jgi:hypothetical protein
MEADNRREPRRPLVLSGHSPSSGRPPFHFPYQHPTRLPSSPSLPTGGGNVITRLSRGWRVARNGVPRICQSALFPLNPLYLIDQAARLHHARQPTLRDVQPYVTGLQRHISNTHRQTQCHRPIRHAPLVASPRCALTRIRAPRTPTRRAGPIDEGDEAVPTGPATARPSAARTRPPWSPPTWSLRRSGPLVSAALVVPAPSA